MVLQFGGDGGSVRLHQNFDVNRFGAFFEIKISDVNASCNALLMSAHSAGDKSFVVEIVENTIRMTTKTGGQVFVENHFPFSSDSQSNLCDGSWQKSMF